MLAGRPRTLFLEPVIELVGDVAVFGVSRGCTALGCNCARSQNKHFGIFTGGQTARARRSPARSASLCFPHSAKLFWLGSLQDARCRTQT